MTVLVLTKIQKDILTDIRVVLAAGTVLRDKGAENYLLGKHLPLDEKDALQFAGLWRDYLADIDALTAMQRDVAVRCIEDGLRHFVD